MGMNHLREIKQPDEIKKGLETCIGKCTGNKPHCPYHSCGDGCMDSMNRDALVLIQQLEAQNAELKRERDAALLDLTQSKYCHACKHKEEKEELNQAYDMPSQCINCHLERSQFLWRGPCEENGGQKEEER